MKQTDAAKFLMMIKTAYPFFEVTEAGTRLWHTMLQDIDYTTAQQRLAHHIRTSKYAPTISEIVQDPEEERSYYDLVRLEEQQEQLALQAYIEQAVPMPDHIRERLERLVKKRRVNGNES